MDLPVGTLTNVAAVAVGSGLGMFLHQRMSSGVRNIVVQALGLCTLAIGMGMALKFENPLALIFSLALGGVIGELLKLEQFFEGLADRLKRAIKSDNALFTDGLVTAFLLFCVGPMTILGALDEGIRNDPTLLYTKSLLDGFGSIALASTYGLGVLLSIIPLFLYQYGLTLFGMGLQDFFSPAMINQITASGGLLIVGIGLNLLEIKRIPLSNLLPSLGMAVLLTWALNYF